MVRAAADRRKGEGEEDNKPYLGGTDARNDWTGLLAADGIDVHQSRSAAAVTVLLRAWSLYVAATN